MTILWRELKFYEFIRSWGKMKKMIEWKYLENGEMVELIQQLDDGRYLVRTYYDCPDCAVLDDDCDGLIEGYWIVVPKIYSKAPIQKKSEKVEKLTTEIMHLGRKKIELEKNLREFEKENGKRLERLAKYKPLEELENFFDNKITHFVEYKDFGQTDIISVEEAENKRRTPLLFLCGSLQKNIWEPQWKLNVCKNDRGDPCKVMPCTSYEKAKELLQIYVNEESERLLKDFTRSTPMYFKRLIATSEKHGLLYPSELKSKLLNLENRKALKAIREHEAILGRLRSSLKSETVEIECPLERFEL